MSEPRLAAQLRIAAMIARARAAGAFAVIAKRGHEKAGAIFVKCYEGAGKAGLFVETRRAGGAPAWTARFALANEEGSEAAVDAYLEKERAFDPDLWIIEIEGAPDASFLDGPVIEEDDV